MSGKIEDIRSSKKQADADAALKREASAAAQELKRARTLYDGLYPVYAVDRALTEQEYTRMRQEYRTRMEQAEKELESINGKIKERTRQMEENQWLKACSGFNGETGITEEMAHALLLRVEIGTDNSVSISLRWQDEYRKLAEFLEPGKEAGQ